MLYHPAILSLLVGSALTSLMLVYSAYYGVLLLRRWDLESGSELQLSLERRTYLVSTVLNYVFGFQLLSLFLFIYTADRIHTSFVGAMCAAGTLNVNGYGYPALILKCVNFLLAGQWLILNAADNRGYDYPLIRKKYLLLLGITPFFLAEAAVQTLFFLNLKPDVITSCCGALFSFERRGVPEGVASLPKLPLIAGFYLGMAVCLAAGLLYWARGKGAYLFSAASTAAFLLSAAALVSVIGLYIYEMPSHRCPFCIIQREYGHVGYLLYLGLLGGGVTGGGVGLLMPFREIRSIRGAVPEMQRRLALASVLFYASFVLLSTWEILTSNFRLGLL